VPVRALVPQRDIPPGLDAIILKCLEKKADNRYRDMTELASDLDVLEKGGMPKAVEDQMQRSGGFNVPADYFRQPAMQLALPGMPQSELDRATRRPRWPIFVAIATGATAAVVGLAIVISSNFGRAQPAVVTADPGPPSTSAASPPATAPVATTTTTAAATATATIAPAAAPTAHAVIVITEPLDAKIVSQGKDLGTAPTVRVKDGETVTLTVSRGGYLTQVVKVTSADEPKRIVKLSPAPSHASGPRQPAAPANTDPDDPWNKPAHR
jgi:serine/threonine-protein kinase